MKVSGCRDDRPLRSERDGAAGSSVDCTTQPREAKTVRLMRESASSSDTRS